MQWGEFAQVFLCGKYCRLWAVGWLRLNGWGLGPLCWEPLDVCRHIPIFGQKEPVKIHSAQSQPKKTDF